TAARRRLPGACGGPAGAPGCGSPARDWRAWATASLPASGGPCSCSPARRSAVSASCCPGPACCSAFSAARPTAIKAEGGPPLAGPRATIVIEWENALDAGDKWVRLALTRLEAEIERIRARETPPPLLYMYDRNR